MKQDMQMLPVRCKGCGSMFDLWPILYEQEQGALVQNSFAKLLNQSFCRNCRKAVLLGMAEKGNFGGDEAEDLGARVGESEEGEVEMSLELE